MVFGIVVEAERDAVVYSTLIRRIRPDVDKVLTRSCEGVPRLRRKFVGWLNYFQWHSSDQVRKALVIRDSDCRDPQEVENELICILDRSGFRENLTFPVHFFATKCMLETWLLADERAVNKIAHRRGKSGSAKPAADPLEGSRESKERFVRMLSQVGLPTTSAVYEAVAAEANLERIADRCPYFKQFRRCVHEC